MRRVDRKVQKGCTDRFSRFKLRRGKLEDKGGSEEGEPPLAQLRSSHSSRESAACTDTSYTLSSTPSTLNHPAPSLIRRPSPPHPSPPTMAPTPSIVSQSDDSKLLAEALSTVQTQLGQLKRCLVSLSPSFSLLEVGESC